MIPGVAWTPLSLVQLVHGYNELTLTSVAPFVTVFTRLMRNLISLTRMKSGKLSLMVYLYFARKAFCSSKSLWCNSGPDSPTLSAPRFTTIEQMASGKEKVIEAHRSPDP